MAEEHPCQTPEGHRLCVNNCGFLGNSTTMNLCSNCYGDPCLKQRQQSSNFESSLSSDICHPSSEIVSISSLAIPQNPFAELEKTTRKMPISVVLSPQTAALEQQKRPNRCMTCKKRVGLTGFKCRCDGTFCGAHRYPEVHGCSFDFKSAGREEIAKANPMVKASKLRKI